MEAKFKYEQRGVSATKDEVHRAIKSLDKGLFPKAFCKILPDFAAGDSDFCNLIHADTAGTKTSLAYMYWKETGDLSVWKGIAQDALVMNLDDMACVGAIDHILISSTIGRNKNLIPAEIISVLIEGTIEMMAMLKRFGIELHHGGGETADVGDIVRTVDAGFTAFARLPRKELIINDIKAGDVVVGLASFGQATYENEYNGGMGSNGLTSARHDVFHHDYYAKYPECFDPNTPESVLFTGSRYLTDLIEIEGKTIPVGKLVLSPTRTYLPVLKTLFHHLPKDNIHGLIHNTGGGQAKVLKFIENKRVVKNNLFSPPPLFRLIQQESGADWQEMYRVFNMGCRLEFYVAENDASTILDIARSFNIGAQIIGHLEEMQGEEVVVESPFGTFKYR